MNFNKESKIEKIINYNPKNIKFLMDKGIRCIRCGEPIWGTLEEAAKEKGFTEEEINKIIMELNKINNIVE
jgi:hypothetical protein